MINLIALLMISLTFTACTNLGQMNRGLSTTNDPAFVTDNTLYTHALKSVSIEALAASGSGPQQFELKLSVDVLRSGFVSLRTYCNDGGTSPCRCELSWQEVNTVSGQNLAVSRKRQLDVTETQTGLVKCRMDQSFWNEIANGTSVRMNIVPVSPNISGLNVQAIAYKKGTTTTANGDFLDDTLTPFRNIHRYSCFSKRTSSYEILNQYTPFANQTSGQTSEVLMASKFCSGVSGTTSGQCATPRNGFSAQSYYRNLYIRSDKLGEINSTNTYYDCPKVLESIRYSAGQTIPDAEKGKYWPLDSSFALATEYSSEWSVGVRAGTVLFKNGDPNSTSDACVNEDTSKRLAEKGIVIKCMGYAKPPKSDGTCGTITDSNGRVRPMVRLRRYRVVYPGTFKSNGEVDSGSPEADEIYVADRLVVGPTGVPTGAMVYGPKPCNFAWFDHEGVVNRDGQDDFGSNMQRSTAAAGQFARPAYVATSKFEYDDGVSTWSVNPDGLIFPKMDRSGSFTGITPPFCSAALPVVEEVMGSPSRVRLVTSHETRLGNVTLGDRTLNLNEIHVRPIDPWSPNYVEDTSFRACAPVADPYVEPPLHVYKKDNDTYGWCSKPYPTQNPYWVDLNARKRPVSAAISDIVINYPAGPPRVGIYNSHLNTGLLSAVNTASDATRCTGTLAATICSMTLGVSMGADYANCTGFLGGARSTCDRTTTFDPNQSFRGFPLQAADTDIEEMLQQDLNKDRTFSCQFSVHPDASKVGKKSPITGCCGMNAGIPILSPIVAGAAGSAGHLEPYVNPANPNVRYCGNPVELP